MPIYLTHAEVLDFIMMQMGLLCAWAVIRGLSDD